MDNKEKYIAKTKGGNTRRKAKTGTKLRIGATKRGIGPAGGAPVSEATGKVFTGRKVDSRIKDALKKSDMVRRLIDQIEIEEEIKNKEIKQEPEKPTYDPRNPPSIKQMKIYEAAKGGMIKKYKKGGAVKKK